MEGENCFKMINRSQTQWLLYEIIHKNMGCRLISAVRGKGKYLVIGGQWLQKNRPLTEAPAQRSSRVYKKLSEGINEQTRSRQRLSELAVS